jgi:hypothetical protein
MLLSILDFFFKKNEEVGSQCVDLTSQEMLKGICALIWHRLDANIASLREIVFQLEFSGRFRKRPKPS